MSKQKQQRPRHLQCRPRIENEWVHKELERYRKKHKLGSTSETIEHILIEKLCKTKQ